MRYWFRRTASNGEIWTIWVAGENEHPQLRDNRGVTIPWERRIVLNARYRQDFEALLIHEWAHVELFAHGVRGHSYNNTPLHLAIEDIAKASVCMPPPESAP